MQAIKIKRNANTELEYQIFQPSINKDIKQIVQECNLCMTYRDVQLKQPLISHQIPMWPWQKVFVDLCRHSNRDYVIIVDSHSNSPDLYQISNQTSESEITAMQHSFSWFGVAEEVFSENGPCLASAEFIQFTAVWDFKRTTSSLLYPHW